MQALTSAAPSSTMTRACTSKASLWHVRIPVREPPGPTSSPPGPPPLHSSQDFCSGNKVPQSFYH